YLPNIEITCDYSCSIEQIREFGENNNAQTFVCCQLSELFDVVNVPFEQIFHVVIQNNGYDTRSFSQFTNSNQFIIVFKSKIPHFWYITIPRNHNIVENLSQDRCIDLLW